MRDACGTCKHFPPHSFNIFQRLWCPLLLKLIRVPSWAQGIILCESKKGRKRKNGRRSKIGLESKNGLERKKRHKSKNGLEVRKGASKPKLARVRKGVCMREGGEGSEGLYHHPRES